jgi:chromosome segregation ATPase
MCDQVICSAGAGLPCATDQAATEAALQEAAHALAQRKEQEAADAVHSLAQAQDEPRASEAALQKAGEDHGVAWAHVKGLQREMASLKEQAAAFKAGAAAKDAAEARAAGLQEQVSELQARVAALQDGADARVRAERAAADLQAEVSRLQERVASSSKWCKSGAGHAASRTCPSSAHPAAHAGCSRRQSCRGPGPADATAQSAWH